MRRVVDNGIVGTGRGVGQASAVRVRVLRV